MSLVSSGIDNYSLACEMTFAPLDETAGQRLQCYQCLNVIKIAAAAVAGYEGFYNEVCRSGSASVLIHARV